MDLSTLSPEEKAELKAALDGEGQEEDAIAQIASVLQLLCNRMEALEKLVIDDFIGGIKNLYGQNKRTEGIEGLKGKLSGDFGLYEGPFEKMYGSSLYEKLFDHLEGLRGGEGFNDEKESGVVKEILDSLKGKFDFVKGPEAPVVAEVTKVEAETPKEETKPAEPPVEVGPMDEVTKTIKRLKGRKGRIPGMSAGAYKEE